MTSPLALSDRLARAQHAGAWCFALLAVAVALASLPAVRALGLRSDWVHLLPADAPSVRALREGEARVGSAATLTVALSSGDRAAMRGLADALGRRVAALPRELRVRRVDVSARDYVAFVRAHAGLYAGVDDLRALRDAVALRERWARERANPLFVPLDDPPEDPVAVARRMEAQAARRRGLDAEGYFAHPDGRTLAIFVRADIATGDAAAGRALIDAVRREVRALRPESRARDLRVELAGDVAVMVEEHEAIRRELIVATALTVALCLAAVYALFRRVRAIPLLGAALLVPVLATFAVARLTVGSLNASTAFLGSIVVGNGVNPGIVWLARYFEERRAGHRGPEAIARTHRGAGPATLGASLAAAAAYGSLCITSFRGFRDFGVIGAVGMVLCWALTLLFLPAFATLWERRRPLAFSSESTPGSRGARWAGWLRRRSRGVVLISAALAAAGLAAGVVALRRDPMEYDFRNLISDRGSSARALNGRVNEIVGRAGSGNAIALLVPRPEDAPRLVASLRARRDAPWGAVRALDDLLPREVDAKRPLLRDLRARLGALRERASAAQRADIDAWLPALDDRALTADALPAQAAALFSERDGTRGTVVLVEEAPGASSWDGRYLIRWSAALRAVRLDDGRVPLVVGRATVFADMVSAVRRDGPRVVAASLAAVVALVALSFARWRPRAQALAALGAGVAWAAGALVALRLRLNFLNFVALPITFGVGADYALNVVRRYAQEAGRRDALRRAATETGAAVLVCSLTTIFGYGSLLTSANRALRSFGAAAVIGELTCVVAAIVALPAALALRAEIARSRGEVLRESLAGV